MSSARPLLAVESANVVPADAGSDIDSASTLDEVEVAA
jgi:hypothetical protein